MVISINVIQRAAYMSTFFEPWLQFHHALVRQLAFCIASPNLLRATPSELKTVHPFAWHDDEVWQQHFQRYLPRLIELDQHPEPLQQFLAKLKSTRLGLRFEYLIWFWLLDDDYHPYTLLAHSLQIIEGKATLGELDFLIYNRDSQCIEHWEVALKYYLAEADACLVHWYGLNRQDTLYKKLQHFAQQQFKFEKVQQYQIKKRFAVMKGQLYLPVDHPKEQIPTWLNPTRRLGHWGHHIYPEHYFRVNRQEWLCLNQEQDHHDAIWWCNGLYYHRLNADYYMFRQRSPLYLPYAQFGEKSHLVGLQALLVN